jgi:glycerol-3-phosphate dehydrogenase
MDNIKECYDIAIIGGGVIGCAVARELSKYKINVVLIEKENDVAEGISKANSGVIHAGFNVKPDTLKARFNLEGLSMLQAIADELGLEYRICKKMVIAKNDDEKKELHKLLDQGVKNNTPGLSIINESEIKNIEPNVNGKYALLSENTGIITPYLLTIALAENAVINGVSVKLASKVTGIEKEENNLYNLSINRKEHISAKWIINAAGLFADNIAFMIGEQVDKIYPCRGEYFILDKNAGNVLDTAIYPVPCEDNRGLGIHLTPTLNGNILIGPSAEYLDVKNDVSTTYDVMTQLRKEAFELMPKLSNYNFIRSFSGIRPKLFNSESSVKFADFYIKESEVHEKFINLLGIESPGLTSAPVIAKYVVENIIANKMNLIEKENFYPKWESITRFEDLDYDSKIEFVEKNEEYAEIICRCEGITKAEILQAISNPLNVLTLDGIKKRTHSMMGRCQSGFCLSRIVELLIKRKGLSPTDILKNSCDSQIITSIKY